MTDLVCGKLGISRVVASAPNGSGGRRQAKVHSNPVIRWERVQRIGARVVVRD